MAAEKSGLLVVDVQNDFCPGGALAVDEGDRVVPVLNAYLERFAAAGRPIYASRDWHPAVTKHFQAYGGTWPPHCVQGSEGAELHSGLQLPHGAEIVTKGTAPEDEGYSAFEGVMDDGTLFPEQLRRDGVTHLYVGGLATDYCVRASALDARRACLAITLLVDAVRGVNLHPDDSERAIEEMQAAGVQLATLDRVHPE